MGMERGVLRRRKRTNGVVGDGVFVCAESHVGDVVEHTVLVFVFEMP